VAVILEQENTQIHISHKLTNTAKETHKHTKQLKQ
jgi:hypothetical protein